MKKALLLALVVSMVCFVFAGSVMASTLKIVGDDDSVISTNRTKADYVKALMALVDADKAGDVFYPERNQIKPLFVPLYKDGELIGYGSWANTLIYQHPEDIIVVIAPDEAKILKWKALDANSHHPEMLDEAYLSKYYNMTLSTSFNPEVDVISGSTISCTTFFFEMRNMLLIFENFGPNSAE